MSHEPEVQALMMDVSSNSESDTMEFIPLEKNGQTNGRSRPAKSAKSRVRISGKQSEGCCGCRNRLVGLALVLSLTVNLLLLVAVVAIGRSRGLPPSPCKGFSASGQHTSQTAGNCSTHSSSASSSTLSPIASTVPSFPCVTPLTMCGEKSERVQAPRDDGYVNIFRDLTSVEISDVVQYLLRQQSLNLHTNTRRSGSEIFGVEVFIPAKDAALNFLDLAMTQPSREALVTLILNGESPPVVRQYVVGPLPLPSYHHVNPRMNKAVPMSRLSSTGSTEAYFYIQREIRHNQQVLALLRESFEVTPADCTPRNRSRPCVILMLQKISFGLVNSTSFTFTSYYNAEFTTVYPLPFQLMVTKDIVTGPYSIVSVFYAGSSFSSLQELARSYQQGTIPKVRMKYPQNAPRESSIPGSMNLRGEPSPPAPHPPPRQYEPKGPRFTIDNQHIRYLEWSFNIRVSVESGPQIWDVKWSGERIVYELSLQEIVVLYAGANLASMFAHLSDSAFGLGDNARPLVPGVDCPDHAQFLSTWVFTNRNATSHAKEVTNSVCVFEQNSGVPLRRHSSPDQGEKQYYGGLVDHYLVARAIIVEYNYDYILDFIFHANGALETRVYATGYIMAQWFHYGEDPFGFKVKEDVVGSLHHHLFHFKVDLDIGGVSDRYETLDFAVDDRNWPWVNNLKSSATTFPSSSTSSSSRSFQQISFRHHIRKTEKDAVFHYNFDQPKYHIFYNDKKKNKFGNVRAYRLEARGFSKQLLPATHPAVRSRKWANYCMAVTEHKEAEMKSSSVFSMFDADDPVVDFDDFVKDNDSIMDKDLVTWVTLGMHHIPHTEDIPNTPTVGTQASILLLPFNYFPECPSTRSRDAVRIEKPLRHGGSTRYHTYGTESDFVCMPPVYGWLKASNAKSYP